MGHYVSTQFRNAAGEPVHRTHQIGTNGSTSVLIDLLVCGYGLARRPESKRVWRWIRPRRGCPAPLPLVVQRRTDLEAIVACGAEDCTWVGTHDRAIDGSSVRPYADPDLAAIVSLHRFTSGYGYTWVGSLTAAAARDLLPAVERIRPLVAANCFAGRVDMLLDVLRTSVQHGSPWTLG